MVKAQHFLKFWQHFIPGIEYEDAKSLVLSFGQNVHFICFFAGLDSSHFPSQTQPVFCPIYMVCLHINPWLEHRSCYASTLLLWSLSALSIWTISLKCFGNAYFYFFSNTETIQQEDKSLVPLSSMCLWHNTQGAIHWPTERVHNSSCQNHCVIY